ncbi:glyceraldehyde-3-phosphate dehydrogenase [Marinococcus halophilus]|uniref:glyceraldehyde-3-phosphate dehydrogenase n=1 Tax=Marinococcus halophilus TaxID=1371 RepID=UPI0009A700FD|nr:glyceraldehyde-3-phosphate dehydrogenase [Marinococcus halophilus]
MKTSIAINGFGRIGRMVFRKAMMDPEVEVKAINAMYPPETLAHLVKYDSVHGPFPLEVKYEGDEMVVGGRRVRLLQNRNPLELPWEELGVDIVVEATGKFNRGPDAEMHIEAGAKKVVLTAPGKEVDTTIVMGVNEEDYDAENHHVISNASCTTNCLAPVVKVLEDKIGIESGLITTVHAYTNDQNNMDNPHKDLRRARACGQSIIPTSTGAAKALSEVIPSMEGKMNGMALRVPTPNVSLVDMVIDMKRPVTEEEINQTLKTASEQELKGIISYCEDPLVSTDFNGNEHSSIIDALSTMVINDRQVKVLAWYDNEWGYSCRVVDLVKMVGEPAVGYSSVASF